MNTRKAFFWFFTLVLMLGVTLPMAKAAIGDEATKVTFSQAVAIPGQVLPAGTYLFVLDEDSPGEVRIFNADRTKIYATLHTVPSTRSEGSNNTAITFAERTSGQPDAILAWFYPGTLDGHEFIYSSREEQEFAGDSKLVVTATPSERVSRQVISGN